MEHLDLEELHGEVTRRRALLEQRMSGCPRDEVSEATLALWRSVVCDQSALLSQTLVAIKTGHRVRLRVGRLGQGAWGGT